MKKVWEHSLKRKYLGRGSVTGGYQEINALSPCVVSLMVDAGMGIATTVLIAHLH
jgi:hypothetical protein